MFANGDHGIGGVVNFNAEDNSIIVQQFQYDGKCPETFFMAGSEGIPDSDGGYILAYPSDENTYSYSDDNIPSLEESIFQEDNEIKLVLPDTLQTHNLKWLSVWCKSKNIDLGSVLVEENPSAEESDSDETVDDINEENDPSNEENEDKESDDVEVVAKDEQLDTVEDWKKEELNSEIDLNAENIITNEIENAKDDVEEVSKPEENTYSTQQSTPQEAMEGNEDHNKVATNNKKADSFSDFAASKLNETIRLFNIITIVAWFAGWYYLYENCQSLCHWLSKL